MERNKSPKRMGRPRSFNIDRALDRAMVVFWRKGYEGASLSDLTKAMGVNRPSLYAASGEAADSIRQELTACRAAGEAAMRRRFERAKSEGDLPSNVNPADLARYIATVLYGMAVEAAGGASRSKLQRVVEMALRTLPM
jgi:AcrR family transcriptional regulator